MANRPRRPTDPMAAAEAAFKPATPKVQQRSRASSVPGPKELVSLRIDRDVLEHFQDGGPGWQDRINEALRNAAGLSGHDDDGVRPEDLNASNDD